MHVCHRCMLISSPCQLGYSVHQRDRKKHKFLDWQLGILWLRPLQRLQFYWTMRPLSWLTARLHHFWTDPLMGDAEGPHCWSWSEIVTILTEQKCTVVVLLKVSRSCNWKTISDKSVLQKLPLCWVQDLGGSHVHTNAHTTKDREQNKAIGHRIVVVVHLYHVPFRSFHSILSKKHNFLIIYHIFH